MNNDLINKVRERAQLNDKYLHLTAYENRPSKTASEFLFGPLSNRYYFGGGVNEIIDWSPFTCLGLPEVEDLINSARKSSAELLSAYDVDFRCLSGVHAMVCSLLALTKPGDTIMIMKKEDGGHFATSNIISMTGRKFVYAEFDGERLELNIDKTVDIYIKENCTAFYIDLSYVIKPLDIPSLRAGLGEDALIIYDASHTLGLIMGGKFQDPITEGVDVICGNTHKTLPGPVKGLIACKSEDLFKLISESIDQGLVSSSHTHHTIALCISILEMESFGKEYAKQIVNNSNYLGKELASLGMEVRQVNDNIYSHTHQVHLYIDQLESPDTLYERLIQNKISVNFDDRQGGRLFIRLGTQEVTRLGMKEEEMKKIASLLVRTLSGIKTKNEVLDFKSNYNQIHYSFDN